MRTIWVTWCVGLSLALVGSVGCATSDPPEGTGGNGGDGGAGGAGGAGGSSLACSSGSDCDDGNECTEDVCDCDALACDFTPREDGTLCAEGVCQGGTCEAIASSFPCTEQGIRDAIEAGGGPHGFDCAGPTTVTISAEIVIDNDVILDGLGDLTIDGDDTHRVFFIPEDTTVELRRLGVTGGRINGIGNLGDLTVTECDIYDNQSGTVGGGIGSSGTLLVERSTISTNTAADAGAGVFAQGVTTIVDSVISANLGGNLGGGVFATGDEDSFTIARSRVVNNLGGGIWHQSGDLTVSDSDVSANAGAPEAAARVGGIFSGGDLSVARTRISYNEGNTGGVFNQGSTTIVATTVSRNAVDAAPANGGGIASETGSVEISNSTISENTTTDVGGGLFVGAGTVTLLSSTVADNVADNGVDAWAANPGVDITVTNSVIAGDCFSSPPDSTDSIESPGTSCGLNDTVTTGELDLGPLADNGGPTETHALGASSAAIDTVAVCADLDDMPLRVDQRGEPRPAGSACDAGSFELGMGGSGGDACVPIGPARRSNDPVGFVTTEEGATELRGNTGGGTLSTDRCPVGQALTGFSYTVADAVQGLAVRCSVLSLRPTDDGSFDIRTTVPRTTAVEGPARGGLDENPEGFNCPDGQVLTGFSGDSGFLIDALTLRCTELEVAFDGSYELVFGDSTDFDAIVGAGGGGAFPQTDCPAGQLASGADIRAGDGIDAIGFRCSAAELIQ